MIPVEWTDYASVSQARQVVSVQNRAVLGSVEDLLHARAITDALLNRFAALTSKAAEEESQRAAKPTESLRSASRGKRSLGSTRGRATASGHRHTGPADRQHHHSPRRGEGR